MKTVKFLLFACIAISCNRIEPGNFWLNFNREQIVYRKINNGPFGGMTEIHWKGKINENDFLEFAANNDWQYIRNFSSALKKEDPSAYSERILKEHFANYLKLQNTHLIYRFKTDWVAIEPGNTNQTSINGFAVIDKKTEDDFKILFVWGE